MTEFGKTPYLSVGEFEDLGYRLVLFPVTALRMATKAIEQMLVELKTHGTQRDLLERMHTRQQLYDLLRYAEYEQRDRQFHSTDDDHATSVRQHKAPTYSPGLDGVLAGETKLCHVDEGEGGLRYLGYAVSDLAEKARFEEVAYLLLFGKLPTQKELKDFTTQLAAHSVLPGPVETFLGMVPPAARPMDILEDQRLAAGHDRSGCLRQFSRRKRS